MEISEEGKAVLRDNAEIDLTAVARNTDVKSYTSEGKPMSAEVSTTSIDVKIGDD